MRKGIVVWAAVLVAAGSYADIFGTSTNNFGTGPNEFSINFVDIGGAGNAADGTYGAVGYNYRIGQKEVTIDQFSKARAEDVLISNGNEDYWNSLGQTVGTGAPASRVSAYEAMKFSNWLTTGSAITGVYQFSANGLTLLSIDRSFRNGDDLAYVLPSEDEWYKAAYYKPVNDGSYSLYANGSNDAGDLVHGAGGWNYYVSGIPSMWETGDGALEQNGTYDMMGNVFEWNESIIDVTNRVYRGGSAYAQSLGMRSAVRAGEDPTTEIFTTGFRVAAIPEPSSIMLICMTGGLALLIRRKFSI